MSELNRRGFLAGALSSTLLGLPGSALASGGVHALDHALDEGWLTTAGMKEGFATLTVNDALASSQCAPSAVRLHGIEASPNGPLAVAVGRRPGHVALVFDRRRGGETASFTPGDGRVFAGHGRFTEDGSLFLTTEIEKPEPGAGPAMGRGIVAARRVDTNFEIVAEWPTNGDGPHDLMRSGASLVVANGGIEPHTPEALDAEVTGSSITLLEPSSGSVRGHGALSADLASLSLRHLARDDQGGTVVAAQELLNDGVARPLLFAIGETGQLVAFDAPENEWRALRGYVGSVAYDRSGRFVACASPRGGRVAVWQADGRYLGAVRLVDGCGLAPGRRAGSFIATSGYGEMVRIAVSEDGVTIVARRTGGPRYDNHMVALD